jgi:hypothetical protein
MDKFFHFLVAAVGTAVPHLDDRIRPPGLRLMLGGDYRKLMTTDTLFDEYVLSLTRWQVRAELAQLTQV